MKTNTMILPMANNLANPITTPLSIIDSNGIQLASQANIDILRRGSQAATREMCKAALTFSAMESVLTLSMLEVQCYRICPSGEERFKRVIDAYTDGIVEQIRRL